LGVAAAAMLAGCTATEETVVSPGVVLVSIPQTALLITQLLLIIFKRLNLSKSEGN
jgi:hypothetical protein